MAKKILSPGQKKRRTISIAMVVLTLVAAGEREDKCPTTARWWGMRGLHLVV